MYIQVEENLVSSPIRDFCNFLTVSEIFQRNARNLVISYQNKLPNGIFQLHTIQPEEGGEEGGDEGGEEGAEEGGEQVLYCIVPNQYHLVREKLPQPRGIPTNPLGTHTNPRGNTLLDLGKHSLMESRNTHREDQGGTKVKAVCIHV